MPADVLTSSRRSSTSVDLKKDNQVFLPDSCRAFCFKIKFTIPEKLHKIYNKKAKARRNMSIKRISANEYSFNPFQKIGKEWMLISAYDKEKEGNKINTMTASWGGVGVLWNKNVFFCFIRPQRYTKEFVDNSEKITLSFFDESKRDALTLCGRVSGRDCDKIEKSGLSAYEKDGAVFFDEAKLMIVGKKLFCQYLDKDSFVDTGIVPVHYPAEDFHMMYVCEIEDMYIDEE
jgi:flavin reductase (DIM6/NTAB) family NADH-FMN oxidoreductase RutF